MSSGVFEDKRRAAVREWSVECDFSLCFFSWDLCFEKKVIVSFWIGGLLKQISISKIVSKYGKELVAWLVSHDWVVG